MTTYLGIDLGTTYTAAAVHDGGPGQAAEVVPLGERGPTIPSVLYLQPDGSFLAGDAAERHSVTDPQRIARQFKRRLGDPTPLMLGGQGLPAEVLTGHLLRWVVDGVVRARGGERPSTIVLTHPANWGPYKRDLLVAAAEAAGVPGAALVTEPQAAAISYSAQARVEPGAVIAVYDLGGGTFDAAVLRKEGDGGFTVLGTPDGIEHLGGIDIDAALFAHVVGAVEDAYEQLDPDDDQALAAVARLRLECTQAKEALSLDSEITVPVLLPTVQTEVRVTRGELESMVRPTLAETVTSLERALGSTGLSAAEIDHVLLVGGSSRIPLVAELVSSGLGRPVAVDAHPKHAVALGAALVAARNAGALGPAAGPLPPAPPSAARPAPPVPLATPPAWPGLPADPRPAPPPAVPPAATPRPAPPAVAPPAAALPAPPPPPLAAPVGMSASPPPVGSASPPPLTAPVGMSASPPPLTAPVGMSASRPPPAVPAAASTPPPPPVHAPPPPPGATDVTGASYGAPAPAASANGQAYGMPATTGPPYGAPAPAASSNGRAYGAAPPPPPPGPYRPDPPGAQPSPLDLTFDPVRGQGPAAPFAYRTALPPIAPGTSTDLPPGYLTGEAREAKLRRDKRRGRLALAVAALVVLAAVAVTVKLKADSGKPQTVAILDVGDCFTGKPSDLTAVDCGQPHQGELFGEIPAPDPEAAYPGARQLAQDIGDGCLVFLTQYFGAGGDAALAKGIDFTPLTPTRDEWTGGATDSFCVAVPAQGQSLTGSIRNKGT